MRRVPVDIEAEKRILIASIVSDRFCKQVLPVMNLAYFQNEYARIIEGWCFEYWKKYKKAISLHIQDVFKDKKAKMKPEVAELVEDFLLQLSDLYEQDKFNADYYKDQAVDYFKKRNAEITATRMKELAATGDIAEAEKLAKGFKSPDLYSYNIVRPFDDERVREFFEEKQPDLLSFPGELGRLVGGFKRGWHFGVMAPYKRGKSWWLLELAVQALYERCFVFFFSLEMGRDELSERLYKRVGDFTDSGGDHVIPVFDCYWNQDGSCQKKQRTNSITLIKEENFIPKFRKNMNYRACSWCRDNGRKEDFNPTVWYQVVERDTMEMPSVRKQVRSFARRYGNKLHVVCYPRFSAGISDLIAELDNLEQTKGITPDVIVVDYPDILRPESGDNLREQLDDIYKTLGGLAQARHCLIFSATQTTRKAISSKIIKQEDTAEDIRKQAHVNGMIAVNQTDLEKDRGLVRINVVSHRHRRFNPLRQITVLQDLESGKVLLDSYYLEPEREEEKGSKGENEKKKDKKTVSPKK